MLNAQEPPRSELQTLSYYHQQGDRAATEAEIRRLRLKYPQWMPPADLSKLSVTAPSQEIDLYYRQIAAGDYEGARSTLAQAKAAFPDWQPPAEMTTLLAVSEGQKRFDEALSAGDPRRAADLAGRIPDLLRCERINNAWRLAEAQTATGRKTQALGLYQSILETCTNSNDLSATLEKADQIADEAQMSGFFDIAFRRFPAEAPRFQALQTRLLAGRGKAAPPRKPPLPMPQAPDRPLPEHAPPPLPGLRPRPAATRAAARAMCRPQRIAATGPVVLPPQRAARLRPRNITAHGAPITSTARWRRLTASAAPCRAA